ncbi:MAG: hypothetical protein ABEI77_10845 [Halorientalis sp.]
MAEIYGYSWAEIRRDLALIAVVGAGLIVIHVSITPAMRSRLLFDHAHFDLLSLYTSAFVHFSDRHLVANLAGYVSSATLAYGLCLKARERRWFHLSFVSFLVVLPLAVGLTNYALFEWLYPTLDPITAGFSGVGAGFTGYVLLALMVEIRAVFGWTISQYVGLAVWLWLLLEVTLIYNRSGLPLAAVFAVLGWLVCARGLGDALESTDAYGRDRAEAELITAALAVGLLSLLVFVLFPTQPASGGTVTNVFAHASGFGYGVLVAGLTYRLSHSSFTHGRIAP